MIIYEAWKWLGGCRTGVWRSLTWGAAFDANAHATVPHLNFFFFFFLRICVNSTQFAPIQLLFVPNQVVSARIKPNQIVSTRDRNNRNELKQVEIGLESSRNIQNWLWMRPKHSKSVLPQFYYEYLLLLLFFLFCCVLFCVSCLLLSLFCESRHSNVFFKNILIVKIYRKYK